MERQRSAVPQSVGVIRQFALRPRQMLVQPLLQKVHQFERHTEPVACQRRFEGIHFTGQGLVRTAMRGPIRKPQAIHQLRLIVEMDVRVGHKIANHALHRGLRTPLCHRIIETVDDLHQPPVLPVDLRNTQLPVRAPLDKIHRKLHIGRKWMRMS